MFKRIRYSGKGRVGLTHDLEADVFSPFNNGHFSEAFANMDAYLDHRLESFLRHLYTGFKEQDLINEVFSATGGRGFAHMCVRILKSKKIIDGETSKDIQEFKTIRNVLLHNLMPTTKLFKEKYMAWWNKIQTQEEFDKEGEEILRRALSSGQKAYLKIGSMTEEIEKNREYYFSMEFFHEGKRDLGPAKK